MRIVGIGKFTQIDIFHFAISFGDHDFQVFECIWFKTFHIVYARLELIHNLVVDIRHPFLAVHITLSQYFVVMKPDCCWFLAYNPGSDKSGMIDTKIENTEIILLQFQR